VALIKALQDDLAQDASRLAAIEREKAVSTRQTRVIRSCPTRPSASSQTSSQDGRGVQFSDEAARQG
jgi:hypothetical protein